MTGDEYPSVAPCQEFLCMGFSLETMFKQSSPMTLAFDPCDQKTMGHLLGLWEIFV